MEERYATDNQKSFFLGLRGNIAKFCLVFEQGAQINNMVPIKIT